MGNQNLMWCDMTWHMIGYDVMWRDVSWHMISYDWIGLKDQNHRLGDRHCSGLPTGQGPWVQCRFQTDGQIMRMCAGNAHNFDSLLPGLLPYLHQTTMVRKQPCGRWLRYIEIPMILGEIVANCCIPLLQWSSTVANFCSEVYCFFMKFVQQRPTCRIWCLCPKA